MVYAQILDVLAAKWAAFDPFPVVTDLTWEGTQGKSQKHEGLC